MAFGQAAPRLGAVNNPHVGESRRCEDRNMVIRAGKICFGRTLVDCTVLDVSPHGARVRTEVIVPLPETVVLRFTDGSSFVAKVQWARGTEIGFALEPPTDAQIAATALTAFNALPADDLGVSLRTLRAAGYFDDPALMKSAEDAEAAYLRFKAMLKKRISLPPDHPV